MAPLFPYHHGLLSWEWGVPEGWLFPSLSQCLGAACAKVVSKCWLNSPGTRNSLPPGASWFISKQLSQFLSFLFFFLKLSQNKSPAALIHWGWFIPEDLTQWIRNLLVLDSFLIKWKTGLKLPLRGLFYGQNISAPFKHASLGMIGVVCVCLLGLVQVTLITAIIINSQYLQSAHSGPGSILSAHGILTRVWLLGLYHILQMRKNEAWRG